MPKVLLSKTWLIRIDLIPGVGSRLLDYCVKLPAIVCTEEVGEGETPNPHVHILATFGQERAKGTDKTPGLIQQMKAHFSDTVFAKSDFAFTVWETHGKNTDMEEYVCKGPSKTVKTNPKVIYRNPMWFGDIAAFHESWWKKHDVIGEKQKLKALKDKQKTDDKFKAIDLIEERIRHYAEEHHVGDISAMPRHDIIFQAKREILAYYRGKVNDHVAFPVLQGVLYRFMPTTVEAAFSQRMDDKLKYL